MIAQVESMGVTGAHGLLPLLIGQLIAGFSGFFAGVVTDFHHQNHREISHLLELATEAAVSKCSDVVVATCGGGGSGDPLKPESPGPIVGDKKEVDPGLYTWGWYDIFAISGWLWLVGVLIVVYFFCQKRGTSLPAVDRGSPTSDSSVRSLAHQQLAELTLKRLHGTAK